MNQTSQSLLAVSIVFPLLAIVFVGLRFLARRERKIKPKADDWTVVAAAIICVGLGINTVVGVALGVTGRSRQELTPNQAVSLLQIVYGDSFLCFTALAVVKVSILLFYKRVFNIQSFIISAWIVICAVVAWWIASIFGLIFSQTPISMHWDPLSRGVNNIDFPAFLLTHASLDLVFDIGILLMPIPIILKLQMKTTRKIGLIGIFWLGGFCVVAEAVRIWYFYQFLYQPPVAGERSTFGSVVANVLIWSRIEPCVSVVAACLPTLGPLAKGRDPASLVQSIRSVFSVHSDIELRNRSSERQIKESQQE